MIDVNALRELSVSELQDVVSEASKLLEEKKKAELDKLRADWTEQANALGVTPGQVLGFEKPASDSASSAKNEPNPPKYRHRENPSLTWTGRGRAPNWLLEYEKVEGQKREDLEI